MCAYTYIFIHVHIYIHIYMYIYIFIYMYRSVSVYVCVCVCVSLSLSLFLRAVAVAVAGCCGCCVLWLLWWRREWREETNRTMSQLIPSAVSLRIAKTGELYQAQRIIGGIGNVLLSILFSNWKWVRSIGFFGELLNPRDNHTWANSGKQNRRWHRPALRVSVRNVPVYAGTTRTCWKACARVAGIHGDVLSVHTEVFSVPHNTAHTHTPRPQRHTYNTTQKSHTTSHGERGKERETERERRQRKRERRRRKRRDKTREEIKRTDKRQDEKTKTKEIMIFLEKNVWEPSNPPDELAQHVSKKKSLSDALFLHFSSKVQNLTVFSIIYMIRIRFFGPGELIQRHFSGAQDGDSSEESRTWLSQIEDNGKKKYRAEFAIKNFETRNLYFETSAAVTRIFYAAECEKCIENQESWRQEVQVGKWSDCLARITSKELVKLHSVKNGILRSACSTSQKEDANLGISALMRIARLMNSLAKGLKGIVTKLQWLYWRIHDNWVAYSRIWSRRSLHRFCGRARTYWSQTDVFNSPMPCYVMLIFDTKIHRLE